MFVVVPHTAKAPNGEVVEYNQDQIFQRDSLGERLVGYTARSTTSSIALIVDNISPADLDDIQRAVIDRHGGTVRRILVPPPIPAEMDDETNL